MIRLALIILTLTTAAHSDVAPSGVWEGLEQSSPSVFTQMQEGTVEAREDKIKDVKFHQGSVYVTVDSSGQTSKLCTADADRWSSEAERAMHLNQRVQVLREAKKSQESVRLSSKGPWSPCVNPTSL